MWNQNLLELFINMIPQSFIFLFLFYNLTSIKINKISFILFGLSFGVIAFLIRQYVVFGVHSAISILMLIFIAVVWGKVNIFIAFISSITTIAVGYLTECLTFIILDISNFNMENLNTDPKTRAVIGFIPLSMIFAIGLTVFYFKKKNKQ